jgi:hypothetical protein
MARTEVLKVSIQDLARINRADGKHPWSYGEQFQHPDKFGDLFYTATVDLGIDSDLVKVISGAASQKISLSPNWGPGVTGVEKTDPMTCGRKHKRRPGCQ